MAATDNADHTVVGPPAPGAARLVWAWESGLMETFATTIYTALVMFVYGSFGLSLGLALFGGIALWRSTKRA